MAEFGLRCDTGDYDTAATVLRDIDFDYLQTWGHYRTLVELRGRIHGRITDPALNANHLGNLGLCHFSLGEYRFAMDLHTQALTISRDIGNRYLEANELGYLGRGWLASGDERRAVALLGQAVSIADATGDIEPAMEARSWLARAHLQLGNAAAALAVTAVEREPTYPLEEPVMHLLEGLALLALNSPEESGRAFSGALAAADALLALADRNVAALEVRALALSGLAVVAGDPAQAAEAAEAFARARAVTRAAGVVADTRRLLALITAHDRSGVLPALDPD